MFGRTKIYTVHVKPGTSSAYEKPVFVREGFNVFAFLLHFLWALYHRLWVPAALIVAVYVVLFLLTKTHVLSPDSLGVFQLAVNVLVGFHANDWLRASLARRGYILADISAGDSLLRAEQRYFERYLAYTSA